MVQQNIVSYIIKQIREGKDLKEINRFLLDAGYDKEEVESSVQYVLNSEKNPELAEQQRIQQLSNYITTQVSRGYDQHVIVNFLIQHGYPYYEVNSAINMIKSPPGEVKIEHKLGVIALVSIILVTVGIGIFYLSALGGSPAVPSKLLDVTTNKLTTLAKPGDDLSFQVNIVNLGEIQRYDVVLDYQIIEKASGDVVSQQGETVAISTSTQRVINIPIPKATPPGKYLLKATATYEEFTATSGFLFQLLPKGEATAIEQKVEEMIPKDVKEPAEEVVSPETPASETEGPTLPEVKPPVPETVPTTTTPKVPATPSASVKEVSVPKSDEDLLRSKTRAEAIEYVKAVSIRDPSKAVSLCKTFQYDSQRGQCLTELAGYKKDAVFCMNIEDSITKDSCIMQLAVETGDTSNCNKIADANIRLGCDMMKSAEDAKNKYLTPEQRAQIPQVTLTIPAQP